MERSTVYGDRFEIEHEAGAGGMGVVFRAHDRRSGAPVALKLLRGGLGPEGAQRFLREAEVLASLRHPAIVGYVAHGATADGERWLALEWLEGETLADRIARAPLGTAESLAVVRRIADGLAHAHRLGLVHRDVKPNNVLLVDRSIDRATLLDFGIARAEVSAGELTRTGAMVGTPGYMAPEQARGEAGLDARADVFSLGCVLFKCLTSRSPFEGEDVLAVLLKVVLDETPRVRVWRAAVPAAVEALVIRMLSKDRDDRPKDAGAVCALLRDLGTVHADAPSFEAPAPGLGTSERRVRCVVLARLCAPGGAGPEQTLAAVAPAIDDHLRDRLGSMGGNLRQLADGSLLMTFEHGGVATDEASRAARAALVLREELRGAPVAVVAGAGVFSGPMPMGDVIDRAARCIRDAGDRIRIDDVAAALLEGRFELRGEGAERELLAERRSGDTARTVLGRSTPFVGRDRELRVLEDAAWQAFDEQVAQAVVITGAPGAGKSRLAQELVVKSRERGVEVWIGRGDPLGSGSPFGMLAEILRRSSGVLDGEPLVAQREKLRSRVGRHLPARDVDRVAVFLCELAAIAPAGVDDLALAAARREPILAGDQKRAAWEDLLAAETSAHPLLLVLEDAQWGDLPTMTFVDAALRLLHDRPLLVLAIGRPELDATFPALWKQRPRTELRLGPLGKQSSELLIRQVLGDRTTAERARELAERAAGNPFYLEELIRAAGRGDASALPETVLAMAQSRLEQLPVDARRPLRAASVFGHSFWRGGVAALLGTPAESVDAAVQQLVEAEVIVPRQESRFPAEHEFGFRHAILRDAAYAMLTNEDAALGHRLAAEWLESSGEPDAALLAGHFARGASPTRAAAWYEVAAGKALEGNDFAGALERAARGRSCGASGEAAIRLTLIEAEARRWRGEYREALRCALDAVESSTTGTEIWCAAVAEAVVCTGHASDRESLVPLVAKLLATAPSTGRYVVGCARAVAQLCLHGRVALADELLSRLAELDPAARRDPMIAAWIHSANAYRALASGDADERARSVLASAEAFDAIGNGRVASAHRGNLGNALMQLGDFTQAEIELRKALASQLRMGLSVHASTARHNLGLALARLGRIEEGLQLEQQALEEFIARGHARMAGGSRIYLAHIALLAGRWAEAEREALAALDALEPHLSLRWYAAAVLASALCARGDADAALRVTAGITARLDSAGEVCEEGEGLLRLAHAEALALAGRREDARAAIGVAEDRLIERAARLTDPRRRASFLAIAEHARTLELSRAWSAAK